MFGPDDLNNESTDAALCATVRPHDTASLRAAVLSQTVGVVRFRRRAKRCILALSLAGCYVAGLATATLRGVGESETTPIAVSLPLPSPSDSTNGETGLAKLTREEIVRRNADLCLLDRGDVKEAVRGYDRFLRLASADHQASSSQKDSWLLMALKDARSKEITHDRGKQD
jgi:hypothetical protein